MVINFFGRRGAGKTTAIRGQFLDCRPPVVVVDILGNFDSSEYTQTDSIEEAIQACKVFYQKSRISKVKREGFSARFFPEINERIIVLKTSNPTLAVEYLSATIWELDGGTLILDEVDNIKITQGSCFDEFIRYGRNRHGDFITGCRRPAEIDRNITAAANKFYCFQTHEPRDIDYFEDIFGDRAELLLKLEPYHGLFLDHDKKSTGIFYIDLNGHIFHTNKERL